MSSWKREIPKKDIDLYKNIDLIIEKCKEELPKKDLTEQEIRLVAKIIVKLRAEQQKIKYKYDFFLFVEDMFPDLQDKAITPNFHIEMYNSYMIHKRCCVVCPRGHAKSTTARIFILHQILTGGTNYVVVIGASEEIASQNIAWIKSQIEENSKVREIWGDLRGKESWANSTATTSTGVEMLARGAGQKIRGVNKKKGRPDLIYIDDLEDDETVENAEIREKMSKWFRKAVLPAKSKGGRIIITGTILHVDSLLLNISKNKIKDHIRWNVLPYKALNVDGEGKEYALWEDMKPLSELKEIQKDDPEVFAGEYQNDPRSGGRAVFDSNWYQYHDKESILIEEDGIFFNSKRMRVIITTDYSVKSKEKNDYSAITASGMDCDGKMHILEYKRWRPIDDDDRLDETIRMANFWKAEIITGEDVVFSIVLFRMLEKKMLAAKCNIPIDLYTRNKESKFMRIKGLQIPIKHGMITWEDESWEIEEELSGVTTSSLGPYDDLIDTIADAWHSHIEFQPEEEEVIPTINSVAWMIEKGKLPVVGEEIDDTGYLDEDLSYMI